MSGPKGLHCRRQCPGERPYTSAPLCHWAVPAPLSGQSFCAAHSTMPRGSSPAFSSYPWPDLPISRPAYAPTTKSPARYRAGRAKQHNHARNVKPFPSSEESGAGSARSLVRPIFLCYSLYHAPGLFPCLFIFSLAGPARRRSPARFLLAKKGRIFVPLCTVD